MTLLFLSSGTFGLTNDELQNGVMHILSLDDSDLEAGYADGIDNNADPDDPYTLEYPIGLGCDVNSHSLPRK